MWYIWKARNDYHFHRKQWTPTQVHHTVTAHMSSYTAVFIPQLAIQGANAQQPSLGMDTTTTQLALNQLNRRAQANQQPATNMAALLAATTSGLHISNAGSEEQVPSAIPYSHQVAVPALIYGCRCYVDASTTPDQPNQQPTLAGLGIFLLNPQDQPIHALYIRARLQASTSVIMGEAACLALASIVTTRLNLTGVTFLSDNEQLVHFLNKQDQSNSPD